MHICSKTLRSAPIHKIRFIIEMHSCFDALIFWTNEMFQSFWPMTRVLYWNVGRCSWNWRNILSAINNTYKKCYTHQHKSEELQCDQHLRILWFTVQLLGFEWFAFQKTSIKGGTIVPGWKKCVWLGRQKGIGRGKTFGGWWHRNTLEELQSSKHISEHLQSSWFTTMP